MARQIEIEFPKGGEKFTATLLEDDAPKTCNAVWDVLPIEADVMLPVFSGMLLWNFIDVKFREPENAMVIGLQRGDVLINIQTRGRHKLHLSDCPHFNPRFPSEFIPPELHIVYGRAAMEMDWNMANPCNLFGRITEDLEKLWEVGCRIREQGVETIRIRRK